jgi:hypothetical protein
MGKGGWEGEVWDMRKVEVVWGNMWENGYLRGERSAGDCGN